jgi:biuret amidohydrolase
MDCERSEQTGAHSKGASMAADDGTRTSWLTKVLQAPTALLLQELQEDVVGTDSRLPALAEAAAMVGVIEHAERLVDAARAARVPVIHCTADTMPGGFGANHNARLFAAARGPATASGSRPAVRPVGSLGPAPDDLVVPRYHGLSPLNGSSLEQLLRNAGIGTLVVAGVSLNIAIPNLVFDAVNAGYQVVLVADAVAGIPVDYGAAVMEHSLGLVAALADTDALVSAWGRRETV